MEITTNDISKMEDFRQRLYAAMSSQVLPIVTSTSHKPPHLINVARQYADTFISQYEAEALIPIHCESPLGRFTLEKIARKGDGYVTRTVKIDPEDFYPASDGERCEIIEDEMIKPNHGRLSDVTWKLAGFSNANDRPIIFLNVTAKYHSPE